MLFHSKRMRERELKRMKEERGFFFGEANVRRCQHIRHSENFPYAKRCRYNRVNDHYCKSHSIAISWINPVDHQIKTAYLATEEEAKVLRGHLKTAGLNETRSNAN